MTHTYRVDCGVADSHGIVVEVEATCAREAYDKAYVLLADKSDRRFETDYEVLFIRAGGRCYYDWYNGFEMYEKRRRD